MRMRAAAALALAAGLWWLVGRPAGRAAALATVVKLVEGGGTAPILGEAMAAGDTAAAQARPIVVISPGHGWWSAGTGEIDPGDVGAGLVEKDVALDVAQQAQGLLARCPVDARLTRTGDDKDRTLANVHELVNAQPPHLAVALHTADEAAPSGVAGWHTVGGWDDAASRRLAGRLAAAVAGRLGLPDRGTLPETASAGGGLYIHPWQAPAVLVELGSLGADSEMLRSRRRDLARAVAEAILEELGLPTECASTARLSGWPVAVAFPEQGVSANLTLINDGLQPWDTAQFTLLGVGETYGAAASYALPAPVAAGESATWAIPARLPENAGVYEQRWQLITTRPDGEVIAVGPKASVLLVVVPPEAQELKDRLDRRVAEWKAAGEAKADEMVQDLRDEIKAWAMQETERQVARCIGVNGALALAGASLAVKRRRRE